MSDNNLPVITVDTFTKIVEMQFKENNFRPIFGLGKGGIGKTESIHDLAKKLGIGYVDVRLLLYSETDLKGIPYPNEDHTRTVWLQNAILPTVEKDGETGILVFDEITSCLRSVRTAAYQLLQERRLGEYKLPDGWMVVCLGNGEEDGGDYQGMEGNFANRCSVFNVVPDVESWKLWAMKHNINELVAAYVSFKPNDLHSYNTNNETEMLFASPRSWTAVSNILNTYGFNEDDKVLINRIIANLGRRVGHQFMAFCKYKNATVDPKSIVNEGNMPSLEGQEVIFITIHSVIKLIGDEVAKDIQELGGSIKETTLTHMANGLNWFMSLPKKEYTVMAFKDLLAYDESTMRRLFVSPSLIKVCPNLLKFASDNKAIFS
ncbi:MAG: hypothetical protein J6A59_04170 [Lachnospiraceae bacterium]|nr:hypothetical protein [Lachnospiraceae bacterium]